MPSCTISPASDHANRNTGVPQVQDEIKEADPKVIILSGGPESVHLPDAPRLPQVADPHALKFANWF